VDIADHGTDVASIAAGSTYGVAKGAIVHSIKVSTLASGTASASALQCAVNWAASFAVKPAVVNMSYAAEPNTFSLRDAINNVTDIASVVFVKAAGNDSVDAFADRANRAPHAIITAASSDFDIFEPYSNFGSTVTVIAPGGNVRSIGNDGTLRSNVGTSFAAPLVTGVAATYLGTNPTASESVVRGTVMLNVSFGKISSVPSGTPNVFLFSNFLP
jgi:subtilisin family serine protease